MCARFQTPAPRTFTASVHFYVYLYIYYITLK